MSTQSVIGRAEPHHIGAGIYSVRASDQCFAAYLTEVNARRVAACLNVCDGISTADLEGADRMLGGKAAQAWLDSHNATLSADGGLATARDLAEQDAVLYGMGLMVNGKHVPADSVMIALPPANACAESAPPPSYCYSYDGELYQGDFDSPLAAAAEVFEGEPGRETVHVGESVHAPTTDYVSADWIIDDIIERAYDECGEVADGWLHVLGQNKEAKAELEKLIADFIDKHERPTFWKVQNCREVTRAEVMAAGLLDQETDGGTV